MTDMGDPEISPLKANLAGTSSNAGAVSISVSAQFDEPLVQQGDPHPYPLKLYIH